MVLTNEIVKNRLQEKFGEELTEWEEQFGLLTCTMPAAINVKVLQFINDDELLGFRFMTDLTGVHYPDRKGEELCVVYHMHNMAARIRLRLKTFVPIEKPDVFTATNIFSAANWMERETYDFFGINFVGHPDLRRILNVDEMDYFPMRKQYQLEDPTRRDKDDEMFGRGSEIF
jgi:NADH-quinone oxidoreductase subunit C